MSYAKEYHEEHPQFDDPRNPITERAICYALEEKGVNYRQAFRLHEPINNIAFNKSKKHVVDLVLTSQNGEKLYVEVKGQMTYLEVNKLRYLLGLRRHFYILQLTEIDWIESYNKDKHGSKIQKFKHDFEMQIQELVDFVNGSVKGKELSIRSINRLDEYIAYRSKDLDKWRNLQRTSSDNSTTNSDG